MYSSGFPEICWGGKDATNQIIGISTAEKLKRAKRTFLANADLRNLTCAQMSAINNRKKRLQPTMLLTCRPNHTQNQSGFG